MRFLAGLGGEQQQRYQMDELKQSHVYIVRTLTPPQRLERQHLLTYLGRDDEVTLVFNARPFAGTQKLDQRYITYVKEIGESVGREDQRHYMNLVVR